MRSAVAEGLPFVNTGGDPQSPPDVGLSPARSDSPAEHTPTRGPGRKRTITGSSSGGDKRVANKICRVCGDKAFSYNFNVITCESCKAFFRRNANKEGEIRCPFNERCEITTLSRRFCQRCRLAKCFEVGMKKEWIMTDEARLEKKARVEENRERRLQEAMSKEEVSSRAPSRAPSVKRRNSQSTPVKQRAPSESRASDEPPTLHSDYSSPTCPEKSVPSIPSVGSAGSAESAYFAMKPASQQLPTTVAPTPSANPPPLAPQHPFVAAPSQLSPIPQFDLTPVAQAVQMTLPELPLCNPSSHSVFDTHSSASSLLADNQILDATQQPAALPAGVGLAVSPFGATDALAQGKNDFSSGFTNKQDSLSATAATAFAQAVAQAQAQLQQQAAQQMAAAAVAATMTPPLLASNLAPAIQPSLQQPLQQQLQQSLQQPLQQSLHQPIAPSTLCSLPPLPQPIATMNPSISSLPAPVTNLPNIANDLIAIPKDVFVRLLEGANNNPTRTDRCSCSCICGRYSPGSNIVDRVTRDLLASTACDTREQSLSVDGKIDRMESTLDTTEEMQRNGLLPSQNSSVSWLASGQAPNPTGSIGSSLAVEDRKELFESFFSNNSLLQDEIRNIDVDPDCCVMASQDQDRLNELLSVNSSAWGQELEGKDRRRHEESCPDKEQVVNMAEGAVRRLIKMSKKLEAFRLLSDRDQMELIRKNYMQYLVLRGAMSYDPVQNAWTGPTAKSGYNIKMDALKSKENLLEHSVRFYSTFKEEHRTNEPIMLIIGQLILFTSTDARLEHPATVEIIHSGYKRCLKRLLYTLNGGDTMKTISDFNSLLDKITHIKNHLEHRAINMMGEVDPQRLEPLLKELCDSR